MINRVLSVRQPWAWALVAGGKDVENRTWAPGAWRGRFWLHASASAPTRCDVDEVRELCAESGIVAPTRDTYRLGAIIGSVRLVDVVSSSRSPWFCGPLGWVVADPLAVEPVQCPGKLSLWRPDAALALALSRARPLPGPAPGFLSVNRQR